MIIFHKRVVKVLPTDSKLKSIEAGKKRQTNKHNRNLRKRMEMGRRELPIGFMGEVAICQQVIHRADGQRCCWIYRTKWCSQKEKVLIGGSAVSVCMSPGQQIRLDAAVDLMSIGASVHCRKPEGGDEEFSTAHRHWSISITSDWTLSIRRG